MNYINKDLYNQAEDYLKQANENLEKMRCVYCNNFGEYYSETKSRICDKHAQIANVK